MEIINSVFTICSTVSETDRQYRLLARKLEYELQKAIHLSKSQKIKNIPIFLSKNLKKNIQQSTKYLQKIQKLLKQDSIPLKQKIKLSLPFNKTNQQVKEALQSLQKAQSDIQSYQPQSQPQNNNKRYVYDPKYQKKQQTRITKLDLNNNKSSKQEQINDQDLDQFVMGPTIQQDAAIGFSKNKYISINIQMKGDQQIIQIIKKKDPNLLKFNKKIQIKFDKTQQLIQQIQLFSLGRIYFKPVYKQLRQKYPQIDRISKNSHFIIKLRRKKQVIQQLSANTNNNQINNDTNSCIIKQKLKKQQEKLQSMQKKQLKNSNIVSHNDQFFSFPVTNQMNIMKQTDIIIVQKAQQKNSIYLNDVTGLWIKIEENQRQICKGQQIAPLIKSDKIPPKPEIYFKINYQIWE